MFVDDIPKVALDLGKLWETCVSNTGQQRIFVAGIQEVTGLEQTVSYSCVLLLLYGNRNNWGKKGKTFAEHIEMSQKRLKAALGNS